MEVKTKPPKLARGCFRFRMRTLFLLTLLVAISVVSWRAYWDWQVADSIRARDAALQNWIQVRSLHRQGANVPADAEAEAQSIYFQRLAAAEKAANRAWWQRR